ncbi:coiled-coil domain-containing protein 89 [Phyllobates terribilis]|uniref:coiled-coil domain-containing protein 89 n=1 Tax=Phyllobates terribilis TaxID=111132 RepID=UPI003CCABA60
MSMKRSMWELHLTCQDRTASSGRWIQAGQEVGQRLELPRELAHSALVFMSKSVSVTFITGKVPLYVKRSQRDCITCYSQYVTVAASKEVFTCLRWSSFLLLKTKRLNTRDGGSEVPPITTSDAVTMETRAAAQEPQHLAVERRMPGKSGEEPAGASVRGVSSPLWDEKTEMGLLRSRLDEQSQLICLLKRRADDTLLRCQGLEADNRQLESRSADTERLLSAEKRRAEQLEERFGLLADNHQDMIRFKDDYKRQNEELRAENQRLREGTDPALQEQERSLRELRSRLQDASTELRGLERARRTETEELRAAVEELRGQRDSGTGEIRALSRRLQLSEQTCQQLQEKMLHLEEVQNTEQKEAQKKMAAVNQEKQDLLQLCMERGRSLQERQREAADITLRLQAAEKAQREAEERYQRDVAAVDAGARVVELNTRLADSEKELAQLQREFEAYKKHSGDLLAKERELNAKLRHLIG